MIFEFRDGHSGGGRGTYWDVIVIDAENEEIAAEVFERVFDDSPYGTTCECCGSDYFISEYNTFEEYKAEETGLFYKKVIYIKENGVPGKWDEKGD